jgi:hypothetical protein
VGKRLCKDRESWNTGLRIHLYTVVRIPKKGNEYSERAADQFAFYAEHEDTRRRQRGRALHLGLPLNAHGTVITSRH